MTRYTPLWEQQGSYAASVDRHLISTLWPAAASSGCAVSAPGGAMSVNVAAGTVAVPSQNATGSTLCVSDAVEPVTIGAAPGAGLNRIDLVICQPRGNDLDGGANNDFIFTTVAGVPAASPAAPAAPAGSVALAQVYVGANVVAIAAGNITDARPGGLAVAAGESRMVTPTTNSGGTASVTFLHPFPAAPAVTLSNAGTGGGQAYWVLSVASMTATGFTFVVANPTGSGNTVNSTAVAIYYHARQVTT
jgi:hypothetical protein